METKPIKVLSSRQRAQLTLWIANHKEDASKLTADDLATKASAELGFPISGCSTGLIRRSVFPEMGNRRRTVTENDVVTIIARLERLERLWEGAFGKLN